MNPGRPVKGGTKPACSVIIPVHNRAGLTRQCIDVLLGEPTEKTSFEIIVVDDASSDHTPSLLREYGDAIQVVTQGQNSGFAGACNNGAKAAASDYLVFLNNDTHPLPGWLDALAGYADEHPAAAVVGSKLLFPDNTIQHAGVVITDSLNPVHIYAGFPAGHPAVNRSRRFPIVTAACALFRRQAFEDAGGFDDSFANGFEDVDLCLRLGELGHEVHYCHASVLFHLEMVTRDYRAQLENHQLYLRRWAHKVNPDALQYFIEDGLLELRWRNRFPFVLTVAPELATVNEDERSADQMLGERARQVYELSRENVRLQVALAEADVELPDIAPQQSPLFAPSKPKAVAFLSDAAGDTMRYRCEHAAEQLESLGATTDVSLLGLTHLGQMLDSYGCFVFHRVPANEHIERFIRHAQRRGSPVIFDTDDLVFQLGNDEATVDLVAMPAVDRKILRERLEPHARTMGLCDAVFVTTEPLARLARRIHPRVFVVPNTVNEEMLRLADTALADRDRGGEAVTVAYFSGTATHDRDFAQAADAVLAALEASTAVHFLLVGNLTMDERFEEFRGQITELPIQRWQRLPALMANVDINLAPLEPDNAFTESKSCLKYLEAALLGVPTVASPRHDFRRVISDGVNGLFAETPDEWRKAIGSLVASSELRRSMGQAAFDDVRVNHTTRANARRLYDLLAELAAQKRNPVRPLTINFVSTGADNGVRANRKLADELALRGHRVEFTTGANDSRSRRRPRRAGRRGCRGRGRERERALQTLPRQFDRRRSACFPTARPRRTWASERGTAGTGSPARLLYALVGSECVADRNLTARFTSAIREAVRARRPTARVPSDRGRDGRRRTNP